MLFFSNHVDFTFPIFDETKLPITSFTLYSREELERLVGILHGELFNGFRPGLFILWAYRMEWKELPTWEWNMLKAETHLFFLGVSPVKIRTDHNGHTVTFYKKTEQYDTL